MSSIKDSEGVLLIERKHVGGKRIAESEFSEVVLLGKEQVYLVGKCLSSREFSLLSSAIERVRLTGEGTESGEATSIAHEYLSRNLDAGAAGRLAGLSAKLSERGGVMKVIFMDPDVERVLVRQHGGALIVITKSCGACSSNIKVVEKNIKKLSFVVRECMMQDKIEFLDSPKKTALRSILRSYTNDFFEGRAANRKFICPELMAYLHMAMETGNNIIVAGAHGRITLLNLMAHLVPQDTKTLMSGISLEDSNKRNRKYILCEDKPINRARSVCLLADSIAPDLLIIEDAGRELGELLKRTASGMNIIASIESNSLDILWTLRSLRFGLTPAIIGILDILIFVDVNGNYTVSELKWLSRGETFDGKSFGEDLLEEANLFCSSVFIEKNLNTSKVIIEYAKINGLSTKRAVAAFNDRVHALSCGDIYSGLESARLSPSFVYG
ncbi:hypothetical protein M1394_02945 [Candidatus Marsarchaeota archaeon]|nr:hypothetical protein [Candidatus Marsarchaeota archaeon]